MKAFILAVAVLIGSVAMAAPAPIQPSPACTRSIAFSSVLPNGTVQPDVPDWLQNWIRKNVKKHAGTCFSQTPTDGAKNFMVVLSEGNENFFGFQAVIVTTSTPISGSGYVYAGGQTWQYTYNSTIITTQQVFEPYSVMNRTLYAVAFDASGNQIGSRNHVYSVMVGGDPNYSLGYNLGSALRNINARGRMVTGIVKGIEQAQ